MSSLPTHLYRVDQVRELERRAIEGQGIPVQVLMERAGAAAFAALRARWREVHHVGVLCGVGNNGGDGYVLARMAREAGLAVDLYQVGDVARCSEAAGKAREALLASGLEPQPFGGTLSEQAEVWVDALFGIGFGGALEGEWQAAVEALNRAHAPILSLDIPSGLHADSGHVAGVVVKAESTVTFVGLKLGLFTGLGPECGGEVVFSDLQLPAAVYSGVEAAAVRLELATQAQRLPPRRRGAHKGEFGHVLVVGGDYGMGGAVRLAAEAALRSGSGLVSVATRGEHLAALNGTRPELMCHAVSTGDELAPLLQRATAVVVGPGLGQGEWGQRLLAEVVASGVPQVLDADALNLLAQHRDGAGMTTLPRVLTPHPGEAARLLGVAVADVQADRPAAAHRIASDYAAVCVLKGSGSVIDDGTGLPAICTAGNPGMASGGMGDLLAGIIAALLAQGLDIAEAARLGVGVHAQAGDLAARDGERGLLATDLLPHIRRLLNGL